MGNISQHHQFLQDSAEFLDKLNALFLKMETGQSDISTLEEAFRCFHSIKSEAAFLEYSEISAIAHEGEEMLQQLLESSGRVSSTVLDKLFSLTMSIENGVMNFNEPSAIERPETMKSDRLSGMSSEAVSVSSWGDHHKNGFFLEVEMELLKEARDRNESCYRVVCNFIPDMPMIYPRAFLILNNLEQMVTVIRTNPDLYSKKDDFTSLVIHFTTEGNPSELRKTLNVDGIESIYITKLPWSIIFQKRRKAVSLQKADKYTKQVAVSVDKLDLILGTLHDLKMKLFRDFPLYGQELVAVEDEIKNLRHIPISSEFNRYQVFVRNTARDLGKKARIEVSGGDILIDRNIIDQLSDPIMQLVRNSIAHGIELPSQRYDSGKEEFGTVALSAEEINGSIKISISDDGSGINEEQIRGLAAQSGLFGKPVEELNLLDMLSTQGFSSAPEVSSLAGRGIGLDVVMQNISMIPGAELNIENHEGEGITFVIEIPEAHSFIKLQIFSFNGNAFALKKDSFDEIVTVKPDLFAYSEEEGVLFMGKQVYSIYGKFLYLDEYPEIGILVPFSMDEKDVLLFADKTIFEEELPKDQVICRDTGSPHQHEIYIAGKLAPYIMFL